MPGKDKIFLLEFYAHLWGDLAGIYFADGKSIIHCAAQEDRRNLSGKTPWHSAANESDHGLSLAGDRFSNAGLVYDTFDAEGGWSRPQCSYIIWLGKWQGFGWNDQYSRLCRKPYSIHVCLGKWDLNKGLICDRHYECCLIKTGVICWINRLWNLSRCSNRGMTLAARLLLALLP